jgi:YD repeat-containing protein
MKNNFTQKFMAGLTLFAVYTLSLPNLANASPMAKPAPQPQTNDNSCTSCSTCGDGEEQLQNKLATLGKQTQKNPLMPVKKSIFQGIPIEYVSSKTGELSFAVNDILFAGSSPLLFQRIYSSNNTEDVGLGKGWNFSFNDKIEANIFEATLTNSSGEKYQFVGEGLRIDKKGNTEKFVLKTDEPAITQGFTIINQSIIKEKNELAEKTYEKYGEAFYLTQIKLPKEGTITLERHKDGRLAKVSNKIGEIVLKWSNDATPRLLGLKDSAKREVSFEQRDGSLRKVKTALGGNWHYEYKNNRLTKAVDGMNRTMLQVKYDETGRATESGDAVRTNSFRYDKDYTAVTDSLKYAVMIEHNENGSVKQSLDQYGSFAEFKWDDANRLTQVSDENGQNASFTYDKNGKLIKQNMRNQGEIKFEYDDDGNLLTSNDGSKSTQIEYNAKSNPVSRITKQGDNIVTARYDANGKNIEVKSSNGRKVSIQHNAKGQEANVSYSDIGKFEYGYDAAGRQFQEKTPSGITYSSKFNADNKIVKTIDSKGNQMTAEYDQSGLLQKIGNGKFWIKNTRDEAGRIIKVESSAGKTRKFDYDARGALVEYTNSKGATTKFSYTEQGKLLSAVSPKGVIFKGKTAKKSDEVSFVKSDYSGEPMQFDGFNQCSIFGDDFGLFSSVADVNEQIIDLNNSMVFCDPYAGSGDSSFAEFGGWLSFGETCSQCQRREGENCGSAYEACLLTGVGAQTLGYAGCVALLATGAGTPIAIACAVLVSGGAIAYNAACYITKVSCSKNVDSKCESKCDKKP